MLAQLALSHLSAQDSAPTCVQHPKASGKWHQQGSKLTEEGWELAGLGDSQVLCVSSWADKRPWKHGSLASLPFFVWCCLQWSSHRRCHSPLMPVRSFAGLTELLTSWNMDRSLVQVQDAVPQSQLVLSFADEGLSWMEQSEGEHLSWDKGGGISSF